MTQSSTNQPIFNINHVGILNNGYTSVDSTQIGIQFTNVSTKKTAQGARTKDSSGCLTLFYSYSHQDETLRDKLNIHLKLLQQQGIISIWYDRDITAGTDWAQTIETHLNTADIILLLISADFLASEYCYNIEMQRAIERHHNNEAQVIPIILRPCDWTSAPFGKLQALPIAHEAGAKAVTVWSNQDEAFCVIAQGIRKVAEDILAKRSCT